MNLLCGHHAKSVDVCNWVISNYDGEVNNLTVKMWVEACKLYLKSLNDGPDLDSTGQQVN